MGNGKQTFLVGGYNVAFIIVKHIMNVYKLQGLINRLKRVKIQNVGVRFF